MSALKVLHVIPAVAARYGGPSQAVVGMCRALSEQGVETLMATTDADGHRRLPVELGQLTCYQGVPTIFFRRQWSDAFKYSRPLAGWLQDNVARFDVIHVHAIFSHASLAAAAACRRQGRPYVVRAIGSLSGWSLRQRQLRKRLLWRLGVRQMLQGAAAIHYTSEGERHAAERALDLGRGAVVPLGIDDHLLADTSSAADAQTRLLEQTGGQPYVLFLGRLHPAKNLELLIDAFLDATDNGTLRAWRLLIAGDGDANYVRRLRRQVATRTAGERVVFTGWLGGADKAAALAGAALLAAPSLHENFGLSIVEAIARGVPVLVSPQVDLAEEIAAAGAGWVVPAERSSLSRALAEILANPTERSRRGAAGRQLARRFRWSAVAEQLVALYRSVAVHEP